jgi:enamine deaminase RidA (YjgF/YER057c/UK114 family)
MSKLTFSNPVGLPAPASRYSQTVLVEGAARRLVISGQVGVTPDGRLAEGGPEAQIDQALANLGQALAAHHMDASHVVKVTVLLTDRALVGPWRTRRDAFFGIHAPTSTLMIVAGLAHSDYVVEVEAEATA